MPEGHDNKTGYKINREALSAILQKCEDYQIIQLSFMEKPALKNGFSLEGHATIVFKYENEFYYFDSCKGFYISEVFDLICNEIDKTVASIYSSYNKSPISISVIDLRAYLMLYMGHDWIERILDKTSTQFVLSDKMRKSFLTKELSTLMQNSYSESNLDSKSNFVNIKSNIKKLLELKADPNVFCTPSYETPLHFARYAKSKEVENLLIEYKGSIKKLDLDQTLKKYESRLNKSKAKNSAGLFKNIIVRESYDELKSFIVSIQQKKVLEKNSTHNSDPYSIFEIYMKKYLIKKFHKHIDDHHSYLKLAKKLIENIPNIELRKTILNSRDSDGRTALIKYVMHASIDLDFLSFLLLHKVDTTIYDPDHNTALLLAVTKGNLDIIKEILTYSMESLNLTNGLNKTAVHLSMEADNLDIYEFLSEKRAKLDSECVNILEKSIIKNKTKYVYTLAKYAAINNNFVIMHDLFREKLIAITMMNNEIIDIINLIAKHGNKKILEILIYNGLELTNEKIKPFQVVTTTIENKHYMLAGIILQKMNSDPKKHYFTIDKEILNKITSEYIDMIESDGWIIPSDKIMLYESIINQQNTFGQLIAMQDNSQEYNKKISFFSLFSSNEPDSFSAFRAAIAKNQIGPIFHNGA